MTFLSDIARHQLNRDRRYRKIFIACTEEVTRSVVEGSEITGAPGQPVQFGTLKGSWIPSFPAPDVWRLVTKLVYAPVIEVLPEASIRSPVGGTRSVAKTITGWPKIVEVVGRRLGAT